MTTPSTIEGELTRWTAHGVHGWGVGTLRAAAGPDAAIVGLLPGARPGDHVVAHGAWEEHPRYGIQFTVARAELSAPTSLDGATAWLVHSLPGVGPSRARALLEHFGGAAGLWAVLGADTETAAERLSEVVGMTPMRAAAMVEAYRGLRASREDQVMMASWGMTPHQIARCAEQRVTAADIRADPYVLLREVPGFGWHRADLIARRSGIPADAPTRIDAGIAHAIEVHHSDGHTWMRAGLFQLAVEALLGVDRDLVFAGLTRAMDRGVLIRRGPCVYSRRSDRCEHLLAEAIRERV